MERDFYEMERKKWLSKWQKEKWRWSVVKNFFGILIFVIFFILINWLFVEGLKREEQRECYQWQEWAKELDNFYLTPAQKEQCDYWSIEVIAPVKSINY
ncbi:MAG: hypothetical protein ACPLW9_00715 [Minisyncoccales bacterium]